MSPALRTVRTHVSNVDAFASQPQRGRPSDDLTAADSLVARFRSAVHLPELDASVLTTLRVHESPEPGFGFDGRHQRVPLVHSRYSLSPAVCESNEHGRHRARGKGG